MTEEQSPSQVPEQTESPAAPESIPASQPAPFVPNTGMTPDWVKARTMHCQYHYGAEKCPNMIDPNVAFTDPESGTQVCDAHVGECEECFEKQLKYRMHPYKEDEYSQTEWFCESCYNDKFTECPNCSKLVNKNELLPPTRRNTYSMKEGGCKKCCEECYGCDKVIDKDYLYNEDDNSYCEDCHSEYYGSCEECNDTFSSDDLIYVEDVGDFCNSCFKEKYTSCEECGKQIEKDDSLEINNNYYCEECYKKKGPAEYFTVTENFNQFSYTKKDRYLNLLYKMLPIQIKDLKSKHPSIAAGLNDLISFSKGKPITIELVNEYRKSLNPEQFPVEYTVWDGIQRSIDNLEDNPVENKPQLVLNVLASPEMLATLKAKPALYDLFDKVNTVSKQSTHPYIEDQIGWIRLELDPNGEYILVDEIQSDHSNASFRLKNSTNDYEINKIRSGLKSKYQLNDEELNKLLIEYSAILKDFPNIASQAVARFARKNNFKKLFWHTYESGKKLKKNEPPKSLYEKTPKENFFLPSSNKPFGLDGEFFEKEAKQAQQLYKVARRLYLKHLRYFI
jgi:hypothetical protein